MSNVKSYSLFSDFDIALFKSGKHFRLHRKFGSHVATHEGEKGTYFAVWAPSAKSVSVVGDFNCWHDQEHTLQVRWDSSGIWEGFIPHVGAGTLYKYKIYSNLSGIVTEKADPYARRNEHPPKTASVVWEDKHLWNDGDWMQQRYRNNALDAPFSVYEVHLGSWKKVVEENRSLSYFEMADQLVNYVKEMNFTHVEFMPMMDYPYEPSWGYQITGYYATSARYGYPNEFKHLVDKLHQANIGVILDWVPSHFPDDKNGLGAFDGSELYEHPDIKKGYHPDWNSLIFNYERNEVRAFLISNAMYWLEEFHIDGLRVDGVASMIFLDYSRKEGEWSPNENGGKENLAAISFLQDLNTEIYASFPDVQTIAEESTAFPMVTKPVHMGGLGFGMKWMMGWMHDTLNYFKKDPIHRKFHQGDITFSMVYSYTENYMLPLSHDEVVYGKNSILGRMSGDEWQRFSNLRLLYGFMFAHPGAKLLFMGSEFGQYNEWNFNSSLDWNLLDFSPHKTLQNFYKDLNKFYKNHPGFYKKQFSPEGFEWVSLDDANNSVLSFMRKGHDKKENILVICNFTPNVIEHYKIGVPFDCKLKESLNSDDLKYGGSGVVNSQLIDVYQEPFHYKEFSATIKLPPLGVVYFEMV